MDFDARAAIEAHLKQRVQMKRWRVRSISDDAVLEFPQGGERIRGKRLIEEFRTAYPASLDFEMRRTIGKDDLWVNEYVIRYDGKPSHVVGIMEFRDGKVFRETIYVGEPWIRPSGVLAGSSH